MSNLAHLLMEEFAERTGVTGTAPPRRYLWTDAFAVCNFLSLHRETQDERYLIYAEELISQVHHVLGRHRPDDPRQGWLSGLPDPEGEKHPTLGGLRIGKKLNERSTDQPLDSRLEWDRDGQYFHYLTKWMHALYRASRITGRQQTLAWAAELDEAAHQAFTYQLAPGGPKRMYWKMSIDLSRPLVESMGHHDPLDGLITTLELISDERLSGDHRSKLKAAVSDFDQMCARSNWTTDDSLGIGGLLDSVVRLFQLIQLRDVDRIPLLVKLLLDSQLSLRAFSHSSPLAHPPQQRLAFRELGLAIGLRGLEMIVNTEPLNQRIAGLLRELLPSRSLADQIESYWSSPEHRRVRTWKEHEEINTVMLATALSPEGYLQL